MENINKNRFSNYFYPAEDEILLNYINSLKNSQYNVHDNISNYIIKIFLFFTSYLIQ